MKRWIVAILTAGCFICTSFAAEIYQFGTIEALMKGLYQGTVTVKQARDDVKIGLGCGVGLGEVIVNEGRFYLADPYGNVTRMKDSDMMPFLTGAEIDNDSVVKFNISNLENMAALQKAIEHKMSGKNIFYAFRIKGSFNSVSARSEDFDKVPYHPLGEWIKTHEHRFVFENTDGIVIGFGAPEFINGIGVGGFHLHFISGDEKKGGHVLDLNIKDAVIEIEPLYSMKLVLPRTEEYLKADLSMQPAKNNELIKKIETGK